MIFYKVVQIWPGLIVCKLVTICPGHIWTSIRATWTACSSFKLVFVLGIELRPCKWIIQITQVQYVFHKRIASSLPNIFLVYFMTSSITQVTYRHSGHLPSLGLPTVTRVTYLYLGYLPLLGSPTVTQVTYRPVKGVLMKDELNMLWKEAFVAW